MKVAFFADAHIGNHKTHGGQVLAGLNDRCRASLQVLGEAIDVANSRNVDVIVSLGDLLDGTRTEPQVIRAVQEQLRGDAPVVLLLGNHERVSMITHDNSLGPLGVENSTVVERSEVFVVGDEYLILVPFQKGPAVHWLESEIESVMAKQRGKKCVALCIHLGIRDENDLVNYPWTAQAEDVIDAGVLADLCLKFKISRVYAGNWHMHKTWHFFFAEQGFTVDIVQVGALVPTGWDNAGIDGYGTVEFLAGGVTTSKVIHGPRFLEVETVEELAEYLPNENKLYIRAVTSPGNLVVFQAELRACAEESASGGEDVAAVEVLVDQSVLSTSARDRARVARHGQTMAAAVNTYFEKSMAGENPMRDQAKAKTCGYLGITPTDEHLRDGFVTVSPDDKYQYNRKH
jgi:hypothetical protein